LSLGLKMTPARPAGRYARRQDPSDREMSFYRVADPEFPRKAWAHCTMAILIPPAIQCESHAGLNVAVTVLRM
jgi:hypothetical protein